MKLKVATPKEDHLIERIGIPMSAGSACDALAIAVEHLRRIIARPIVKPFQRLNRNDASLYILLALLVVDVKKYAAIILDHLATNNVFGRHVTPPEVIEKAIIA